MDKFSKPLQGDNEALSMSIPEVAAIHIAERLRQYRTCVELCTAVGAMAIHIARVMPMVYGIDINPRRIKDAKHNAKTYGVEDNTKFMVGDVLDERLLSSITAEVAILDPDWSIKGNDKSAHALDIDDMQPSMRQMILLTRRRVTSDIIARVPKHVTLETLAEFGPYELENIYIDNKLKFKVAYFLPWIRTSRTKSVYLVGLNESIDF